jgi:hypothetical protein
LDVAYQILDVVAGIEKADSSAECDFSDDIESV